MRMRFIQTRTSAGRPREVLELLNRITVLVEQYVLANNAVYYRFEPRETPDFGNDEESTVPGD
jgi:hypothetical protein